MKRIVYLFIFILMFSGLSFAWWNPEWKYRREITIKGANPEDVKDYQVMVEINFSDSYSSNKIQQYCQDVVFTYYDQGKELEIPHWTEKCNLSLSGIAIFWVKVPEIISGEEEILYVYYGNSKAEDTSNGDATFLLFDDFKGSNLNRSKWDAYYGTPTVQNGYLNLTGARVKSLDTFLYNVRLRSRWKRVYGPSYGISAVGFSHYLDDTNGLSVNQYTRSGYNIYYRSEKDNTGNSFYTSLPYDTKWHTIDIERMKTYVEYEIDGDDIYREINDTFLPNVSLPVKFYTRYSSDEMLVDWVFVSQYIYPEPEVRVWSEEKEIHSCGIITESGRYVLISNITDSSATKCFDIKANNVVIDCQGHLVDGIRKWTTYGVYVYRSSTQVSNITIENCNFRDWIYGMYFYRATNNTVRNTSIISGYGGLYINAYSYNNVLDNLRMDDNSGFDVFIHGAGSCNNQFTNVMGTGGRPIVYYHDQPVTIRNWNNNVSEIILCNADHSVIDNVTMMGKENNWILLRYTDYINITNVYVKDLEQGIRFHGSHNRLENVTAVSNWIGINHDWGSYTTFKNVVTKDNSGWDLYYGTSDSTAGCSATFENVTGSDNKPIVFYGNQPAHISNWNNNVSEIILCNADHSVIDNVTIDNSVDRNTIMIVGTDYSNFTNIHLTNVRYGLYLYFYSENNIIKDSTITSSSSWGMRMYYRCNNNLISNVTFNSNYIGLRMYRSNNNTITNCKFEKNSYRGIYMYYAGDTAPNKFYNDLFNNTNNFYFAGTKYENYWNSDISYGDNGVNIVGGPWIGGNYWGKPDGTGFSDTCTDNNMDGFCDSYYTLSSTGPNIDYLPLSKKYDHTPPSISFVEPTPGDKSVMDDDWVYLSATINDERNTTGFFDWNRSLVAYISFDNISENTIYDESTYGNDATFHNGVVKQQLVPGMYGRALKFDGKDDYAEIPVSPSIFETLSGPITIEVWFKTDSLPQEEPRALVMDTFCKEIAIYLDGSKIYGLVYGSLIDGGEITPEKWHHAILVHDHPNGLTNTVVQFYLDGDLKGEKLLNITTQNGYVEGKFLVGVDANCVATPNESSRYFNGTIDEVRIWNRALRVPELKSLFALNSEHRIENNFTEILDGTYEFYAYAKDKMGNSAKTGTRKVAIDTLHLKAETKTDKPLDSDLGKITLTWPDKLDNEKGFRIERSTDGSSFTEIATVGSETTSYTDDNLEDNQVYYYRIRAYTDYKNSSYSNIASAVTKDRTGPTTSELTAVADNINNQVKLNWSWSQDEIQPEVSNDGLVARWDFEEGSGFFTKDNSGNWHYGIINGASFTTDAIHGSYAMSFDGNGYVEVPDRSDLRVRNFTIVMIIKPNDFSETRVGLIQKTLYKYEFAINLHNDGSIDFYWGNGTSYINGWEFAPPGSVEFNRWQTLIIEREGTTGLIYVDGRLVANKTFSVIPTEGTGPLTIGKTYAGYFKGLIDDVRIYNRALSEEEIKKLMLVGYWHFDEGSGSTVKDASSFGNDGTIHGATWTDGIIGKALQFDGVDDYVEVPDSNSLDATSGITIEALVYLNSDQSGWYTGIQKSNSWQFRIRGTNNPTPGEINTVFWCEDGIVDFYTGYHLKPKKWYYLAATYDSETETAKVYVNGELIGSKTVAGAGKINITSSNVLIGKINSYFNGTIDDVRIWRRALSEEEIRERARYALYRAASGEEYKPLNGIWDDFEDGDYTNDPTWRVGSGHWEVYNGVLIGTASTGECYRTIKVGPTNLKDFILEVDVKRISGTYAGPIFRRWKDGSGWLMEVTSSGGTLWKDGTGNVLTYSKPIGTNWVHVKVVAIGNRFKGYINDDQVFDYVDEDNTYPEGSVGLAFGCGTDPEAYFDNFKVIPLNTTNNYTDTSATDTTPPSGVPSIYDDAEHDVSTWSNNNTVTFTWDPATDYGNTYFYYVRSFDDEGNENNLFNGRGWTFEGGNLEDGFWEAEQRNSSVDVVSTESYSGYYSVRIHRDGPEPYPGTCYEGVNESPSCSWNGTHCVCNSGNSYLPGQQFQWPDTNRVMWVALRYGSGGGEDSAGARLGLKPNHTYILTFKYKGNVTSDSTARVYICYTVGWCDQGKGYPTLDIGTFNPNTNGEWKTFSKIFTVPDEMFTGCGGETCLRELAIAQLDYASVSADEDLYMDDVKIYEVKNVTVTTGVDGYSVVCDTNPDTLPDTTKDVDADQREWTCTFSDGQANYVHIRSVDKAGNWNDTAKHKGPYWIDTVKPSITYVKLDNYFVKADSTINITTDGHDSLSGISTCHAYLSEDKAYDQEDVDLGDLGVDCSGLATIPSNTQDGTYYIIVRPVDKAGNSNYKYSAKLIVDSTSPVTSITGKKDDGSSYTFGQPTASKYVLVTILCTDNLAGCHHIYYCVDRDNSCIPSLVYTHALEISTPGETYIRFNGIDNAGNEENVKFAKVILNATYSQVTIEMEYSIEGKEGDIGYIGGNEGNGYFINGEISKPYVCSYDSSLTGQPTFGIVSTGKNFEYAYLNETAVGYKMRISEDYEDNEFVIPVTKGGCSVIDSKISSDRKITTPFSSFLKSMTYPIAIILQYTGVDIVGNVSGSGTFDLVFERGEGDKIIISKR